MGIVFTQNLSILVTEKCNFSCKHCMRGESSTKEITDETIESIFDKIRYINNLGICGGEPFMAMDRIKKIFDTIMKKEVIVLQYGLSTNGTRYDEQKVNEIFNSFENYVKWISDTLGEKIKLQNGKTHGYIALSLDFYHLEELKELEKTNPKLFHEYMKNIKLLHNSKYFSGYRELLPSQRLFDEGNAKDLNLKKSQLRAIEKYWLNSGDDTLFGPIIGILPDGMITECNGSYDNLKQNYNYGNINTDEIREVIEKTSIKCKTLRQWNRCVYKSMKKYSTYK